MSDQTITMMQNWQDQFADTIAVLGKLPAVDTQGREGLQQKVGRSAEELSGFASNPGSVSLVFAQEYLRSLRSGLDEAIALAAPNLTPEGKLADNAADADPAVQRLLVMAAESVDRMKMLLELGGSELDHLRAIESNR